MFPAFTTYNGHVRSLHYARYLAKVSGRYGCPAIKGRISVFVYDMGLKLICGFMVQPAVVKPDVCGGLYKPGCGRAYGFKYKRISRRELQW
jgi:hypothetical protein